jgi:hypothetical protein
LEGVKFPLEDQLDRHKHPIASVRCGREGVNLRGFQLWSDCLASAQGSKERGQTESGTFNANRRTSEKSLDDPSLSKDPGLVPPRGLASSSAMSSLAETLFPLFPSPSRHIRTDQPLRYMIPAAFRIVSIWREVPL